MDKKRIIYIIIFILVTILLGFAVYRVFFSKKTPLTPTAPPTTGAPGQFPTTGVSEPSQPIVTEPGTLPSSETRPTETFQAAPEAEQEIQVVDDSIVSPTVDKQGIAQFYNEDDGKFYRVGRDGRPQTLSDEEFFGVENVVWSPNSNESIIEYPDGNNIFYNFQTSEKVTLPKHWENFSFSNTGDQIAAKSVTLAAENRWIIASDPDGSNIQFVEEMGNNQDKVTVDWSPNEQIVALSRTGNPLGSDRQEVLLIGKNRENFKSLVVEGRGLQSEWSTEGKQLMYSVHSKRSEFKPELWIVEAEGNNIGNNRRPILLNTWADKCTFASERFVFCGVPRNLPFGSGLQPTLADNTPYDIYKIDLQNSRKSRITLDNFHVVDKVFASEDGKTIQFTDIQQDGLFRVDL